jgi:hypothetical protein
MKKTCWEIKNRSEPFWSGKKYFNVEQTKFHGTSNGSFILIFNNNTVDIQAKNYGKYISCFKGGPKVYMFLIFFEDGVFEYDITKDVRYNRDEKTRIKILEVGNTIGGIYRKFGQELYHGKDSYKIPKFDENGNIRSCFTPISKEAIELYLYK